MLIAAATSGQKQTDLKLLGLLKAFQKVTGVDQYKTEDVIDAYGKFIARLKSCENLRSKYEYIANVISRCVSCGNGNVLNTTNSSEIQL